MKIESIIFDLDGTLIESSAGIEYSARQAVEQVLPGARLPSLRRLIGPPIRDVLRLALADMPAVVVEKNLPELEHQFRESYDTMGWRMARPCEGAANVLTTLRERHLRCYVVTNKPAFAAINILRELGLARHLSDILSRDSRFPTFTSKSATLEHLLDRHEIDPDTAAFVGDSHDDAVAARTHAVRFIAASYGYGLTGGNDNCAATINALHELPSTIDALDNNRPRVPHAPVAQRAMT